MRVRQCKLKFWNIIKHIKKFSIKNYFDDHVHELCQSCHSSCLTCSDENFDSCDSCDSSLNRVLQGYVCKCKDGFFENSQGVCEACSSTC